jgi:tRNA pseudouridine38-40 synthase
MKNIALRLAYDGTRYFGWQKNNRGPSIEQTLQEVLEQVLNEQVVLQAASRTDRGVHAEGQVVNFFTKKSKTIESLLWSLNALLPKDITIIEGWYASLDFHPTLHAVGKKYAYTLCFAPIQLPFGRLYSWHLPYSLNLEEMKRAASHLVGTHDFSAFCTFRKNLNYPHKIRTIDSIELLSVAPGQLSIEISGTQFLYKMVRTLVGTLVSVGRGTLQAQDIPTILATKSRCQAGVTAPPHGLTLKKVFYPQEILPSLSWSSLEL